MSGTPAGGKLAAQRNKERHGEDFYVKIGTLGGTKSRNGGFAQNRELAREAGRRGGKMSRRPSRDVIEARIRDREHNDWKREHGL